MLRFRVHTANIDPDLRRTFERYGVIGMQVVMGTHHHFLHQGRWCAAADTPMATDLLAWLTEKAEGAERWETVSLTMEAAIIVLIVVEIVLSIISLYR
jgi:hypothetical protein